MFRLTTRLSIIEKRRRNRDKRTRKTKTFFKQGMESFFLDATSLHVNVFPYNNRCTVKWEKNEDFPSLSYGTLRDSNKTVYVNTVVIFHLVNSYYYLTMWNLFWVMNKALISVFYPLIADTLSITWFVWKTRHCDR